MIIRKSLPLALVMTLSACGGGGGAISPAPAPPPAPTPAPTNTTLTNLQFSQSFAASGARVTATASKATGTASGIASSDSNFGGTVSLDYNAANAGYTVRTAAGDRTFLPPKAASTNATLSVYEQVNGTRQDQLVLFNPGAANPQLALTYASYGAWQTITDTGANIDIAQQFFVYGIRQAANTPSTGSASYMTRPDGFWTASSGLYALGGTSTFTANFQALTVATSLNLTGTNVQPGGTPRNLGLFSGTGSIAAMGGGFTGTFTHQGADQGGVVYTGGFNGAFFGPQGQEVGYTFRLTSAQGAAVGAVVGKAN